MQTEDENILINELGRVFEHKDDGRYLCFGKDSAFIADWANSKGWHGTLVTSAPPTSPVPNKRVHIAGVVGPDAQIKMLILGYYTRMITVKEIFNQFPGPYDLIACISTGRDREIYGSQNIMDALPLVYVIPEDGHNTAVVSEAEDRGYWYKRLKDRFLMLVHR